MNHTTLEVGTMYPNWYGKPALILAVFPYTGKYPQWFTHVVRLYAPNTKRGWLEMAVDTRAVPEVSA